MKEVAEYVGVSEGTVSRWESGDISNMKRDKIYKLAKILKISPLIILGWEDQDGNKSFDSEPKTVSDEDVQFALFGGRDEITEKMYEEVKNFAAYLKQREGYNEKRKSD
jgi:transcriptional regulator with XRE-family HTH domain